MPVMLPCPLVPSPSCSVPLLTSKHQHPEKHQLTKLQIWSRGSWCLELEVSLELGAWSFTSSVLTLLPVFFRRDAGGLLERAPETVAILIAAKVRDRFHLLVRLGEEFASVLDSDPLQFVSRRSAKFVQERAMQRAPGHRGGGGEVINADGFVVMIEQETQTFGDA